MVGGLMVEKNYPETRADNIHKTFTADVDLQDQYHEHYERPTPIDKKLADEFEKDYKKK